MDVKYYALQRDEKNKTREKFLFSDDMSLLMVGQQVEHKEIIYRVNSTEWMDQEKGKIKAICLEIPNIGIEYLIED